MKLISGLRQTGIPEALGAALLFGASTPFAKLLLNTVSPWMLAGLLYLGSGADLAYTDILVRHQQSNCLAVKYCGLLALLWREGSSAQYY